MKKFATLFFLVLLTLHQGFAQNIAEGKDATASSGTASAAVDGNNGTRWESEHGVDPQWIIIDLGQSYTIGQVILTWEAAYATAYTIDISDDNTNWTTIYTEEAGNGATDELSVSGTGRYIRMNGTTRATGYGYSLWEFEVYEAISSAADATLSDLTIDGTTVDGFSSNTTDYNVELPVGTTEVPTVVGTTSQPSPAEAVVTDAASLPGTTTVLVTAQDGSTQKTYSINFTVDKENIALNKTAVASTENQAANNAFDGDMGTRWESVSEDPQSITVDLGRVYQIDGVMLSWEGAYGSAYTIEVSENGTDWTTVYTEAAGDGGTDDLSFTATNGRYVKMNGTARGTGWGYSLWEFEVYGKTNTTWDGAWSNGEPDENTDVVIDSNDPPADFACKKLTINASTSLIIGANNKVKVTGQVVDNGNGIVLQAGASSRGQILLPAGHSAIQATVQMYFPADMWTSFGFGLSNLAVVPQTPSIWFVKYFDESADTYSSITSTDLASITATQGFVGWSEGAAQTVTVTGELTSPENQSYTLDFSNGAGWNLIANPYACRLNTNLWTDWTRNNVDDAIYVRAGGNWLTTKPGEGDNEAIEPFQAFFVKTNTGGGSLTVANAARALDGTPIAKKSAVNKLKISVKAGNFADRTEFYANDNATQAYDGGEMEALKLYGNEAAPQLFSKAGNKNLSINAVSEFSAETELRFSLVMPTAGTYELSLDKAKLAGFDQLWVEDTHTGATHGETFEITSQGGEERQFIVHFAKKALSVENATDKHRIISNGETVRIELIGENSADLSIYTLQGQLFSKETMNTSVKEIQLPSGAFIIKLRSKSSVQTQQVAIR